MSSFDGDCADIKIDGGGGGGSDSDDKNLLEEQLKQAAQTSKRKEEELEREIADLVRQTQRVRKTNARDEIEALESKSKRLKNESDEAHRLGESLEFEALCLALRRNDPTIKEIPDPDSSYIFPAGFAQPLGNVLQHNTHVSSITLYINKSVPWGMDETNVREYVAPLVGYLEIAALQYVTVWQSFDGTNINPNHASVGLFVEACFRNQSLKTLEIGHCNVPARVFGSIKSAISLQELFVSFGDVQYTPPELQLIEDAFRHFPCLRKLHVKISNSAPVASILSGLCGAKCHLDDLELDDNHREAPPLLMSALSDLLHAVEPLGRLSFDGLLFSGQGTTSELIRGLTPGENSVAQMIVKELYFHNCSLDEELFVGFMHTRVSPQQGQDLSKTKPLDRLHIGSDGLVTISAVNLVSLLCPQPIDDDKLEFYPTIGSQIKALVVDEQVPGFLPLLAENANLIGLTSLCLDSPLVDDIGMLTQCISKLTSLRELKLSWFDEYPLAVLCALKVNWNLHSVIVHDDEAEPIDSPVAKAYCDRNQFLDQMLLDATRDELAAMAAHSDGNGTTTEYATTEHVVGGTSLVPTLFQVANQIPSQRSTALIRSLGRLPESIGF
jgi:hypothetical protein